MIERIERYAPLTDISVRSEGDGRTVDAYAAVFDRAQEIRDREGHYFEEIAPEAFGRTLSQRADRLQYMFNHGKTMYGTPSERFSMPIGTPIEVRADGKGLWTTSRVAKTELGDEVLELIRSDAIKGQSFSGSFAATDPDRAATEPGGLPTKRRTEIALREYGPTPFPAYAEARVVGVRSEAAEIIQHLSICEIAEVLAPLSDEARSELLSALSPALADPRTGTDGPPDTRHAFASIPVAERKKALRRFFLEVQR